MARIGSNGAATPRRVLAIIIAAALFGACTPELDLRMLVEREVTIANQEWRGIKSIADGPAYAASVGISGNNIYVLYYDASANKLMIKKSGDRGVTWATPFIIDNTTGNYSTSNNIAVDGSNIYISYQRANTVYFMELSDTGSGLIKSNGTPISDKLLAYQYGYENAVAYDTQYVYVVYGAGADPAFSRALKGTSMTFSTPVYIDSSLTSNSGNRKRISLYIDSAANLNVCYYDSIAVGLKNASFDPAATSLAIPASISRINIGTISTPAYAITDAGAIAIAGGPTFITFYDMSTKSLKTYERFTYTYPPLMLGTINTAVTIDSSSSDIGEFSKSIYVGTSIYTIYYDAAGKQVKFAIGTKHANNPPAVLPEYTYSTAVIDAIGGTNVDCSLAYDSSSSTFYAVYYDSAGGGQLKFAKSMDNGATW